MCSEFGILSGEEKRMNPFGNLLSKHLRAKEMRANALAARSGMSPAFISALRKARKVPSVNAVNRVAQGLGLTDYEREELFRAAEVSHRHLEIPAGASPLVYDVIHELVGLLHTLQPGQLEAIRQIARLTITSKEGRSDQE